MDMLLRWVTMGSRIDLLVEWYVQRQRGGVFITRLRLAG